MTCTEGVRGAVFIILMACILSGLSGQEPITADAIRAQDEFRWGVLAFNRGLFNEAALSFEKALTFRPEIMLPRLWLGRAYYMSGFEDAALNEWRTLLQRNQGSAALQNLSEIISYRRGAERELASLEKYVSAFELESGTGRNAPFMRPAGIRLRGDGSLLLASYASNEIIVLDQNGAVRQKYRDGFEGFSNPFDIVIPSADFFFVSELSANRIAKCNPVGNKLLTFGKKGRGDGDLLAPQYLAADNDGYLYVSDWGNRRIVKFDFNGAFISSFGAGTGDFPGFRSPTGVAFADGRIYVADRDRKAIFVFDASGNYLSSLVAGKLHAPEGLQSFRPGLLLVADTDRIVVVDIERDSLAVLSELDNTVRRITQVVPASNGNLVASDFDAGRVSFLSELPSMYSGLFVRVDRVIADKFPEVAAEITVETRSGDPVIGLSDSNFHVTEDKIPVANPSLSYAGYKTENIAVSFLVERSRDMLPFRQAVRDIAARTGKDLKAGDAFRVITAGDLPVVEYSGVSPTEIVNAATEKGSFSDGWKFDTSLRLAASELIPDVRKKAVVFLSTGRLDRNAFDRYGLLELSQYMKNNGIRFHVVAVNGGAVGDELMFLVRESRGSVYSPVDPKGTVDMIRTVRETASGKYVLKYRSNRDSEFGRAFLPIEVEVSLMRKSGRDESGYFSPSD